MKKKITTFALIGTLGLASLGMAGCVTNPPLAEEPKPYIQVSGLDTTYIQNQEINLDGAKILYYSDKNDTIADEITLTNNMIANFNTATTGEKKMKIIWNGFELEVEYTVSTRETVVNNFIEAYRNAHDYILSAEEFSETILNEDSIRNVYVANGMIYSYAPNIEKIWIKQVDDSFVQYTYDIQEQKYTKKTLQGQTALIDETNVTMFLPQASTFTAEQLEGGMIDYCIEENIITYIVDFMELASHSMEFKFEDGKIIGFKLVVPTNVEKTEFKVAMEATISYSVNQTDFESLPNVTWEDEL